MRMRTFLIPIVIGLLLIAILLVRVIGMGRKQLNHLPKDQEKKNVSAALTNSNGPVKGFSDKGKVRADVQNSESAASPKTKLRRQFKTFYDNGTLSSEWDFEGARLNGTVKTYYPNGATWKVMSFRNNQLDGPAKVFYPSGEVLQEIQYVQSKLVSLFKQYYEKGFIWIALIYRDGKLMGFPRIYSQDKGSAESTALSSGELQDVSGSDVNPENKETPRTLLTSYYSDKMISSEWGLKQGILNGLAKIYYPNKASWCTFLFQDGQVNGETDCYYETGELLSKETYLNGVLDGTQTSYYQSGAKWIETVFENGKIKGVPKAFSENGKSLIESPAEDPLENE